MSGGVHDHLFTFDPTDERDADPTAVHPGVLSDSFLIDNLTAMEFTELQQAFYDAERLYTDPGEVEANRQHWLDKYNTIARSREKKRPGQKFGGMRVR
jgi:hypothetical protein